ncbi:MAG: mechanosensitive ion channel [Hyphomicrobiales bacterium]|nr:mechanosensitive ion channel [Hyphomicrobiales bacterium]
MTFDPAQLEALLTLALTYGVQLLYALAVAFIGFWMAGFLSRRVYDAIKMNKRVDDTLAGFASSFVKYAIVTVVVLAVLQMFGIQTTSLIAVLGAASLAIGLALQGTLTSFAAGVMLLVFRPFKVGNVVTVAGYTGSVRDITIFTTELATENNVHITIPNKDIWGAAVTNFSTSPERRVDVTIGVDYSANLQTAITAMRQALAQEPRIIRGADVVVSKLGDKAVELTAQGWAKGVDHDALKSDLALAIKNALDVARVPFPRAYPEALAPAAARAA